MNSSIKGAEIFKFKAKDSEIKAAPLCLGNVQYDFSVDNMKKTGNDMPTIFQWIMTQLNTDVDDNLDIHKCLMKRHNKNNLWNN